MPNLPGNDSQRNPELSRQQTLRRAADTGSLSQDQKRLADLIQQIDSGVYFLPKTREAVELCRTNGCSLRTAYRWIDSRNKPRSETRPPRSDLWKELRFAMAALARADKLAAARGAAGEEIAKLEAAAGLARDMLDRWRAAR